MRVVVRAALMGMIVVGVTSCSEDAPTVPVLPRPEAALLVDPQTNFTVEVVSFEGLPGWSPTNRGGVATGQNNRGAVVGWYNDGARTAHGFLWTAAGGVEHLVGPDGTTFVPFDINDQGQIAGHVGPMAYVRQADGSYSHIDVPGMSVASARAINASGEVALMAANGGFFSCHFADASLNVVASWTLGLRCRAIFGMNDLGEIVGDGSTVSFSPLVPWVWTPAAGLADLSAAFPPNPRGASLLAINNAGQIVGATLSDGVDGPVYTAYLGTKSGSFAPLTRPEGVDSYDARGINDLGVVSGFGYRADGMRFPVLWVPGEDPAGTPISLPLPPPEVTQAGAVMVNNEGQVAGFGSVSGGATVLVVWSPEMTPLSIADCRDGGWEKFGFSNQGLCIRFVLTGKDGPGSTGR